MTKEQELPAVRKLRERELPSYTETQAMCHEAAELITELVEAARLALEHAERHAYNYLGGDSLKRASEELQPARDALAKARGDTQSISGECDAER